MELGRYLAELNLILITLILCDINYYSQVVANSLHIFEPVSTQEFIAGDIFFEIIDPEDLEYTYRLRPARNFGAPFNSSFKLTNAALVLTEPLDGCSEIRNVRDMIGSVALLERGECSFLTKTINAERAGARAAIITEIDSSADFEYYIEMVHDNSERETNIPAGFLLGKNGKMIQQILKKHRRNFALINFPVNLTFTPAHLINHPPWQGF